MKLLTRDNIAENLGLSVRTIDAMVKQRKIPVVRIGRKVRFNPNEIEKWINKREIKTA